MLDNRPWSEPCNLSTAGLVDAEYAGNPTAPRMAAAAKSKAIRYECFMVQILLLPIRWPAWVKGFMPVRDNWTNSGHTGVVFLERSQVLQFVAEEMHRLS